MQPKVVIANTNAPESAHLKGLLDKTFDVQCLEAPVPVASLKKKCDLLVLDTNFTPAHGLDFLKELLVAVPCPVLMVARPAHQRVALEALRYGATNYLVKAQGYTDLLSIAVIDDLERFKSREELRNTVSQLRDRVFDLEHKLHIPQAFGTAAAEATLSPAERRKAVLDEISSLLKRGELNLPAFPELNTKFRGLIEKGTSMAEITGLLKQDPGVTSKLISVANSTAYRGSKDARSLEDAVSRLGLATVRGYVEVVSNRSLYKLPGPRYVTLLNEIWRHSLACARAARIIAVQTNHPAPDEIYAMGLLHDIGKLLLLQLLSELELRGASQNDLDPASLRGILASTHAQFGARLIKRWQLPEDFAQIARYHENLEGIENPSKALCIVNCANLLALEGGYGKPEGELEPSKDSLSAKYLNLEEEDLAVARDAMMGEMLKNPLI
jgi:HD-like signal output (HDOD) protein/DNA-binding NarL/FixJ family response regulator